MGQVKLNPSLADAWLCLGNCIWKKGDLTAAKNCLSLALVKVSRVYFVDFHDWYYCSLFIIFTISCRARHCIHPNNKSRVWNLFIIIE